MQQQQLQPAYDKNDDNDLFREHVFRMDQADYLMIQRLMNPYTPFSLERQQKNNTPYPQEFKINYTISSDSYGDDNIYSDSDDIG